MPKLIVFAGPNGSGKSTLYLTNRAFFDIPRVNVDEIVREIGGDWRKSADLIRAGKIALRRTKDCLEKRVSFNRETTLCGKTAVQDIVEAKKLGFEVELYFVSMDLSSFDFLPLGEDTEILPFDCNDVDLNNFLPYLKWNGKLYRSCIP